MPKGDAARGKADTEDGYAKVARVLLEALACAPLSGSEFQVVMFVVRRTYGWASSSDPNRGKLDVMTGKDVALGTGLPKRTAEKALGTLVKEGVICCIPLEEHPGSPCAYGINTDTDQWYGGPEWRESKVSLKQAQEVGSYTQKSVLAIPEKAYWQYAKKCNANTQKSVLQQAVNPCGTGAPDALQQSLIESLTENDSLGAREGGSEVGDNHPDDGFQDSHMALCNYPELSPALEAAQPRWTLAKRRGFVLDLIAAIEDPNTPVARQEVTEWLATDGMRPSYADRGDSYLRRMIAKREAAKRDGVPDARADPILAAHIAKEGPRPLDAMAAMIWDRKLEEARGEVRQTA